jgi:ABC-type transporter Mla MlaB component
VFTGDDGGEHSLDLAGELRREEEKNAVPFSIVNQEGRQLLKLAGAVTVRDAQELANQLGTSLEDGAPLRVDTGCLEDIDTCILQLLCSLRKTVRTVTFERPSDVFIGAMDRCGLRRELAGGREDL